MTETMMAQPYAPESADDRLLSKDARITAIGAEEALQKRVRVKTLSTEGSPKVVGKEGVLRQIDRNDSAMTFLVDEMDESDGGPRLLWVYDVELVKDEQKADPHVDCARRAEQLRTQAAEAQQTLDRFREQVREVAIRVADDQDWCDDGLNSVLEELGLEPKEQPEYEMRVRVVRTFRITARTAESHPSEHFAQQSITVDGDGEPTLDSDWDDEYVELVDDEVIVDSVEEQ